MQIIIKPHPEIPDWEAVYLTQDEVVSTRYGWIYDGVYQDCVDFVAELQTAVVLKERAVT